MLAGIAAPTSATSHLGTAADAVCGVLIKRGDKIKSWRNRYCNETLHTCDRPHRLYPPTRYFDFQPGTMHLSYFNAAGPDVKKLRGEGPWRRRDCHFPHGCGDNDAQPCG